MVVESIVVVGLHVEAEADPGIVIRILERFQTLNLIPRRVSADATTTERIYIDLQLSVCSVERIASIAAKIQQLPTVIHARWHRL